MKIVSFNFIQYNYKLHIYFDEDKKYILLCKIKKRQKYVTVCETRHSIVLYVSL